MSEHSFREFPDPVVAAYLDKVRRLSDAQFAVLNGPTRRLVRWNNPVSWLIAPIAAWLFVRQRILRRTLRYLSTARCQDQKARREYKTFYADLAHRGTSDMGEMHIGIGLLSLRTRDTTPKAVTDYRVHMEQFVPADALGWTVQEPSA